MGNCYCGQPGRLYASGWHCDQHTPAARAGLPEPDTARYCAPNRCYCGTCPSWVPYAQTPLTYTAIDRRAILSSTGRRTNLAEFREAQRQAATTSPERTP